MDYLIVVEAPGYPVSEQEFATESAFAEHLKLLRQKTKDHFERMIVAMPVLTDDAYQINRKHLGHITTEDGIYFLPLHPQDAGSFSFWFKHVFGILARFWRQIGRSEVVHSGLSMDVWRPVLFIAISIGWLRRKRTIFVVDIDNRKSALMNYKTGRWSLKSYLLCRHIYDRLRSWQIRFAARYCDLVLLKSALLVRDYGKGRPHVKNFFDTAHSSDYILTHHSLKAKLDRLEDNSTPLKLSFFGRLVGYKGIGKCIEAVHQACRKTDRQFQLYIIGNGEEEASLKALVQDLKMEDHILFHPPIPYGSQLFDYLYKSNIDVLMAAPLSEDTPRSAFDAMAAGLPIIAFDIAYYEDLKEGSKAVLTSEWPSVQAMADNIIQLDQDREQLKDMTRAAVRFAQDNTQDIWLDRRVQWTLDLNKI